LVDVLTSAPGGSDSNSKVVAVGVGVKLGSSRLGMFEQAERTMLVAASTKAGRMMVSINSRRVAASPRSKADDT